jgi:CheY-like chemotaxis protein
VIWTSSSRRSPPSFPAVAPAELCDRNVLALVVEADPGTRRTVRHSLENIRLPGGEANGTRVRVVEADTGRGALSMLSVIAPALIILDLVLPELSGYELCERLRANDALQHIPVLAISARSMPEDRAAAEEVGVSAFLARPFSRRELEAHILPLLSAHRATP